MAVKVVVSYQQRFTSYSTNVLITM